MSGLCELGGDSIVIGMSQQEDVHVEDTGNDD